MALETNAKIKIDTSPATNSLKELRAEINSAKNVMLSAEEGSKEYADALQLAANKAFQLREMNELIKNSAGDLGEALNSVNKVASGIASGFAAAQGAIGLFGIESEDLNKTLVKVQSALALASGLQGLEGMGKNLKNLGTQLMQFGVVQKTVTALQWLWNAALAANPIGLVIAGIAALGAAIYGLTKYFEASEEAIKKENTALDGLVLASEEAKEAHNQHIAVMEDLNLQLDLTTGKINDFEFAIIELAAEYAKQVEDIQSTTDEKLEKAGGFWNQLWNVVKSGGNAGLIVKNSIDETTGIVLDGSQKLLDAEEEYQAKQQLLREKKAKKDADAAKKAEEDKRKQLEKDAENEYNILINNINQKEEIIQLSEANIYQTIIESQQKLNDDVKALNDKSIDDLKKKAEQEKEIALMTYLHKRDIMASELDLLNTFSQILKEVAGKNKKIMAAGIIAEKAVAIGNIWNNNAIANAKSIAAFPLTAGQPWVTINTVAAGLQTALVVAQTAKALRELGSGDSGGGSSIPSSSNGGTSVAAAPKIPQQIMPSRNILTQNEQSLQNQPIKAYVVETEISAVKNRVSSIEQEATF